MPQRFLSKPLTLAICLAACTAVVLSVVFLRNASGEERFSASVERSRYARSRYLGQTDPKAYRLPFTPDSFGKSRAAEIESTYGIDFVFPPEAAGGQYEGVFIPQQSTDGYEGGFLVVYTNDVTIRVTRWPTNADADDYLSTFNPVEFQPYVKPVEISGHKGYASEKVNVPPISEGGTDPATGLGRVRPGTGLSIPASSVAWTQGRFVVEVVSGTSSMEDLLSVAKQTSLQAPSVED
ncbi:MAG: hypothetical protein Q8K99_12705 [Actinomycetota bacterium]|nr:hypothetical protein [Actinomycetota bacterium]